jgi:hypothetical protein
MSRRKQSDDEEWWYDEIEACTPGPVGSATTVSEVPRKRRQKVYRRRIGFLVNIDELIEAD